MTQLKTMKNSVGPLVLILTLCLFLVGSSSAQTVLVILEGKVTDAEGNGLPGATVTIRNEATGFVYSSNTDADGDYILSGIEPGRYDAEVSLSGFATFKRQGMTLQVGSRLTLNFTLELSDVQEEVTVIAEAPMVEVTKSDISSVVDRDQIDDLPLLDRDYTALTILKPGVQEGAVIEDTGGNGMPVGHGQSLVDGTSNTDVGWGDLRTQIPADAIQEFRVFTNQFQAEYGNAAGMLTSAIIRSGTNEFRGRVSFFHRNEGLDSPNYFVKHPSYGADPLPKDQWQKAEFNLNRFGGFIGGPIAKDKAHFFVLYEGMRRSSYTTITSPLVPHETIDTPQSVNDFLVKINFQPNEKNLLSLRFGYHPMDQENSGVGGLNTKERAFHGIVRPWEIQGNWTFFPSDNTMNEFRLLYTRGSYDFPTADGKNTIAEDRPSGNFGSLWFLPEITIRKRYQINDTFSWFLEDHTVKFGFDYSRSPISGTSWYMNPGWYHFATDEPFDANNPATYPFLFLYNPADVNWELDFTAAGFFVQDSWKVHPRLTLNIGLRYNYYYADYLDLQAWHPKNLNPRFGFSWDPVGDGKTSIRGGIGTYSSHTILTSSLQARSLQTAQIVTIINPGYPDPWQPNPFAPTITIIPPLEEFPKQDNIAPYSFQTTLGIHRELVTDLSGGVDFVYARGYHLMHEKNLNPVIPGTSWIREDPTKGDMFVHVDEGRSAYTALYFTLKKRYSRGWTMEISYTLSRSKTDTEQPYMRVDHYDDPDRIRQYGYADTDARHRIAISGAVDLPMNIQLSGLLYYRTALPWNAQLTYDANLDGQLTDYVDEFRNSRRGFDFLTLNLRLSWSITFSDRFRLQVFGEGYNITNRTNFAFATWGRRGIQNLQGVPGFGEPYNAHPPRQIQLGARFDW